MRLTGNEVALIAAGLTTWMAIVTVRTTRWTTNATLQHQRDLAQDERVWRERSALYLDMADWLNQLEQWALDSIDNPEQPITPPQDDSEIRETMRLHARIDTFASDEVKARDQILRQDLVTLYGLNTQVSEQTHTFESLREVYRFMVDQIEIHQKDLIDQIRMELKLNS